MNPESTEMTKQESSDNRKSSVETEMENYLKSELGIGASEEVQTYHQPDVVQSICPVAGDIKVEVCDNRGVEPDVAEPLVTSAIISVDDLDDANNVNDDKKDDNEIPTDNNEQVSNNHSPQSAKSLTPPSKITLPKIQISPDTGLGSGSSSHSSLSPSRIPSRKNSAVASQASQSQAINEDLRRLETRLEKFVTKSSEGSECSESSDQSRGGGTAGAAAVSSRLHTSGTASSRAKTAEKSGNVSPQEKTTTMLKNTLRKMTRFSIGSKKKEDEDNFVKPPQPEGDKPRTSRTPFLGKSRVPKSQSPGPSSVSRSKSFKEPGAPVSRPGSGTVNAGVQYSGYSGNSLARNNVYTSSLRRTKIKHQQISSEEKTDNDSSRPTTQPLGRSGTGGLERGAMRRSVSASRGGANLMSSSVHNGSSSRDSKDTGPKLVKKSRPVQTSLTKDPCHDTPDSDNPGLVNFQVWLPELLGGDGCDVVETQVTDHSEPVDVRKNRALTLENMKLQREVERLRGFQGDNEFLKKEVKGLKVKLEEEQKCRVKIQSDLVQYQDRVKACMESMDCVERQFESRDLALQQMEGEQARMEDYGVQLRSRLGQAELVIGGQKKELERSLAAQKTLIHQLQESEQEAREMQEFLQAEKSTLQEALREGEQEIRKYQEQIRSLETRVNSVESSSASLSKQLESKAGELNSVKQELGAVKDKAREMLLAQGAELSRASVAIVSLTTRLESMVSGGNGGEDVSEESDPPTHIDHLPSQLARRSSQFLITPTVDLDKAEMMSDFSKAMMATSTGSDSMRMLMTASTGSDQLGGESSTVPGLTEQISNIEDLVAKLVIRSHEMEQSQQENMINGNTEESAKETVDKVRQELKEVVVDNERKMSEMMAKFSRNRQILTSNWEQAENEVRRLDDIYHDTVDRVVLCLASLPELTQQHPSLAALVNTLQLERDSQESQSSSAATNHHNNLNGHKVMSRSLMNNSSTDCDMTVSQSALLTNSNMTSLSQSIMSDPGMVKPMAMAASPHITPHLSREDMNANQSL